VTAQAPAPGPGLGRFVARLVVLCVVLFAAWYLAARPVAATTAWLAARLAEATQAVERVRQSTTGGKVVYEVEPDHETARRHRLGPYAVVDVPANPLKHSFGLPFFLALLLAGMPKGLAWKAALGCSIVIALAAVGLACELLVQLGSMPGFGGEPLFAFAGREAIALGFQLGTLVFPTVVPAMLWVAMDRATLRPYLHPS
jgi:hypothetical protein